jgi:hypothetical protein
MTASDAPSAASARVSATTEPFLAFREILIAKFGRPNAVDAFEHVCGLVNLGVERRTMRAVLRNDHLRKFFGHVDADDPALARAYLDARRGMLPAPPPTAMHDSPNKFSAKMTVRLTSDDAFFARSAGALFRVPERIHAQDLLAAMRRLRPPVPDVDRVSVADVLAFVDEWDSSDYLRRDVGVMHAVDFVLFLRFAAADEDARGVTNDLGIAACVPGSTAARLTATAAATVRRQAVDTIASKRAFATRDARRALARREGEALAGCLREELAVYGAQRDPAVGGLERPHAFRVTFEPGRGCVAKLTPEPTLALALAASDDAGAGFVTPAETALALAQCRVPLTAVESAAFGEHLARRPGARSSRHLWCVDEVLETLDCEPLPGAESPEDFPVVVAAWRAGARRAIEAEYLGGAATDAETREGSSDASDDSVERDGESRRSVVPTYDVDLELLRHVAAPAPLATASPAVAKAAEACLVGYRAFARFLAAFDNELGRAGSGGSGGRGCVTVSNVRYAGACARVASPSVRVAARLETLADAFPPGDFFSASGLIPGRGVTVRTTGARERLIDWRAMLDGCGPSAALLAQEKAAGSAVGGVVSLRACVASAAPGPLHAPGEPVQARRSRRESRRRRRPQVRPRRRGRRRLPRRAPVRAPLRVASLLGARGRARRGVSDAARVCIGDTVRGARRSRVRGGGPGVGRHRVPPPVPRGRRRVPEVPRARPGRDGAGGAEARGRRGRAREGKGGGGGEGGGEKRVGGGDGESRRIRRPRRDATSRRGGNDERARRPEEMTD